MITKHCILTGVELTPKIDSKAHVIPSALGGRLKPKGILSGDANETLNDKFDLPLIQSLQPIMALVGGARDRGENRPTRMYGSDGKELLVVFGKPVQLSEPEFDVSETSDGKKIYSIRARTMKEARNLLGRVKKDNPSFDINEAMKHALVAESYSVGQLSARIQIGPISIFPAVFGMAAVYAAHCGLSPHPEFTTYVGTVQPLGTNTKIEDCSLGQAPLPPDTFYWMPSPNPIERSESVTHILLLVADPDRKEALIYVELFNLVCVGVRIPFFGNELMVHRYGIDIVTGKEFDPKIDVPSIRTLPWAATHQFGDAALIKKTIARMNHLLHVAHNRSRELELTKIVSEELGEVDGRPVTAEQINRIVERVTKLAVALMTPEAANR
jgi:hypothetical protein